MNTLSTRRYLSVWLRRLSTDRIERRLSAPADTPRVVVASIKSAQRIVALNDCAARLGLRPDMPLADARAMYPSLPVADADPEADRRLLAALVLCYREHRLGYVETNCLASFDAARDCEGYVAGSTGKVQYRFVAIEPGHTH